MSRLLSRLVLAALVVSVLTAPAFARRKQEAPTSPGKYTEWGGEIDELEVVQSFKLADYTKIVVEPFDTKGTPLPDKGDNTYEAVRGVLAAPAGPFIQGLSSTLADRVSVSQGSGGEDKTLLVRAKVVSMEPGSRAARFWAGFGAGAARGALQGEVLDAASAKVLLRFTQERRSSAGALAGDYVELMNRNLWTIGEDIAGALKAF
jgi:hypothetical protein